MADVKISELPALTSPDGAEELVVNDGGTTKKIAIEDLFAGDNVKAKFGAGDDLQIYHDGANSYIKEAGTGDLIVLGNNVQLRNTAFEYYLTCITDAGVTAYYNNVAKLATTSTGVDVTGGLNTTGTVLVGRTSVGTTGNGHSIRGGDSAIFSRDASGETMQVGRNAAGGELIRFKSNGATVGSIGTSAGGAAGKFGITSNTSQLILAVSGSTDHLQFDSDQIYPSVTGSVSLGHSSYKFNNAYLSGGLYLGGVGSSNKLDDYEEGTWTPAIEAYTGTDPTVSATAQGWYTKIGNLVTLSWNLDNVSVSGVTSGILVVSGLPFSSDGEAVGSFTGSSMTLSRPELAAVHRINTHGIGILSANGAGGSWGWENVSLFNSNSAMRGLLTYKTNA